MLKFVLRRVFWAVFLFFVATVIMTILGMDLGLALGGAVFTESIFNLPGLGHEVISAYTNADLPVITGVVTFATVCVIAFNFVIDVTYGFLDPRIRPS